tara:strand:+ start:414 stop:776 length:363 start_codon:yes stop_codon:yes gene_type:complete
MGTIKIVIEPQVGGSVTNEINVTSFSDSVCTTTFGFDVIVSSDSWIEWSASNNVTITGGVSGETILAGTHSYTGTITGFESKATRQNTETSSISISLKDSNNGTLLDSLTLSRDHSLQYC